MFNIKFSELLHKLDISSSELSSVLGCDRSHISRLRSGKRSPKKDGEASARLINAIIDISMSRGEAEALANITGSSDSRPAALFSGLKLYLFDETNNNDTVNELKSSKVPYENFGIKFSKLMSISGLSNVRLGKLINMDPSYISRFRNGLRSPASNVDAAKKICSVFINKISEQGRLHELIELIQRSANKKTTDVKAINKLHNPQDDVPKDKLHSPQDDVPKDKLHSPQDDVPKDKLHSPQDDVPKDKLHSPQDDSALNDMLYNWLYDNSTAETDQSGVHILLRDINDFTADFGHLPPAPEQIVPDSLLNDESSFYTGVSGLRTAVLRFLGNAIKKGAHELLLYSDQNMDWLTSDSSFLMKWKILMILCIKSGIRIRIIHNLDRNADEMISAINGWLPLYMSGMIDAYYMSRPKNTRFSHTLFICPGISAIKSFNVSGSDKELGVYRYDTDTDILEMYRSSFGQLIASSERLMDIKKDCDINLDNIAADNSEIYDYIVPSGTLFDNTSILIGREKVVVHRIKAPRITFIIRHKLLCNAFFIYARNTGLTSSSRSKE